MLGSTILISILSGGCAAGGVDDPGASAGDTRAQQAQALRKRVDLRVLVLSNSEPDADGKRVDLRTAALRTMLDEALVPYDHIDLTAQRSDLTEATLVDGRDPEMRRAKYQAVVLASDRPSGLKASEQAVLEAFEREFGVRQLDVDVRDFAKVGLVRPGDDHAGALDGAQVTVTAAGRRAGFSYLNERFILPNLTDYTEAWAFVPDAPASAAASAASSEGTFTPLLEVPPPGAPTQRGVLVGVHTAKDGREEMVLTASIGAGEVAMKALFPGLLRWLTQGVHLGLRRSYLSVHIDDVFMSNDRFDRARAEDRTLPETKPRISMDERSVPKPGAKSDGKDVTALLAWQRKTGLKLDMAYNGSDYDEVEPRGETGDELSDMQYRAGKELLAHKDELRWISHTYKHEYLGCQRDEYEVCRQDVSPTSEAFWTPLATIQQQISENLRFATARKLPNLNRDELVTGEHGGLKRPGRGEPTDNPFLIAGLRYTATDAGPDALPSYTIATIASDNSIESQQRELAPGTLTVPRYPMTVYYNAGTREDTVDEYNYFYARASAGGNCEGLCQARFDTGDLRGDVAGLEVCKASCLPRALDHATGFDYVAQREALAVLRRVTGNDPRPHYVHQSNLAEDRILYPVLDRVLADYEAVFSRRAAPIANPTMTEVALELQQRARWVRAQRGESFSAYVEDGKLVVSGSGALPLTVPGASNLSGFTPWDGELNGWQDVSATATSVALPDSVRLGR